METLNLVVNVYESGKLYAPKTAGHVLGSHEEFPSQTIFNRLDVMEVIDAKSFGVSNLLRELMGHRVIESISRYGKEN